MKSTKFDLTAMATPFGMMKIASVFILFVGLITLSGCQHVGHIRSAAGGTRVSTPPQTMSISNNGRVLLVVVYSNIQAIDSVIGRIDTVLIPLSPFFNTSDQTLMKNELIAINAYDSTTQSLSFFETPSAVSISAVDSVSLTLVSSQAFPTLGEIKILATTEDNLHNNFNSNNYILGTYSLNNNSIPTLSEWGLIILGLILLSFGVVFIRKRQFQQLVKG